MAQIIQPTLSDEQILKNMASSNPLLAANSLRQMNLNPTTQDSYLQKMSNANPESADKVMDFLGYSNSPNIPTTLDASKLGESTIKLPQSTPFQVPDITRMPVTDVDTQAFQYAQSFMPKESEASKTGANLQTRILDLTEKLTGKKAFTASQEQNAGIPEYNRQLNELNTQIKTLQNEANAKTIALQGDARQNGIAGRFLQGDIDEVDRKRAIKALELNSVAQAIQGNYNIAKDMVDRAVEAEFGAAEQQLALLKEAYSMNKDTLEREDKQAFQQAQLAIGERERLLNEAKENKKGILELVNEAARNQADNVTLTKIREANSVEEAQILAAPFLGKVDREQKAFENQIKLKQLALNEAETRAQIANIQSQISERNSGGTNINPIDILAYAQQYASTGKIPTGIPKGSFGIVAQTARELPKPEGSIVDVNTGTKPDISDAKLDGLAALYDINQKVSQLKELEKGRVKGLTSAALGKVFGSDAQTKYMDLRTEIIDLLARARTGAALTTQEEKFYKDQLPGRIGQVGFGLFGADTQLRIDNFSKKIEGTLDTKLKANGSSIVGFSKVKIGDTQFKVGDIIQNPNGQKGRVNFDGTITPIQ